MRGPRQVQRHPIAHRHGQCGAQRIAQGRGAPAELSQQGFPAPLRGTDEQLPLVAHQAELGRHVAARQRRHLDGLVIDVADAVGHAVQQGRCIGGFCADRLRCQRCWCLRPGRQHAGQLWSQIADGLDGFFAPAQQQGHAERLQFVGGGVQRLLQGGQHGHRAALRQQPIQIQLASQLVVARFQQAQQHGGVLLARAGRGGFQHHIARGLQLVGQAGLLVQHGFEQQLVVGVDVEALGLCAQDLRKTVQTFRQQLRPKALVEQVRGQHGPQQIQPRAGHKPGGVLQDLLQRTHRRRSHGKQHRKQQRKTDRSAAFAPGHQHHGQKRAAHQHRAQQQRVLPGQLHQHEQRRAQQRRGQHLHDFAPTRRGHVGQAGDDDANGCAGGSGQPG